MKSSFMLAFIGQRKKGRGDEIIMEEEISGCIVPLHICITTHHNIEKRKRKLNTLCRNNRNICIESSSEAFYERMYRYDDSRTFGYSTVCPICLLDLLLVWIQNECVHTGHQRLIEPRQLLQVPVPKMRRACWRVESIVSC